MFIQSQRPMPKNEPWKLPERSMPQTIYSSLYIEGQTESKILLIMNDGCLFLYVKDYRGLLNMKGWET
jgi:hypothetical protein